MSITDGLTAHEKTAVALLEAALDIYNTYDGTGLFSGMDRYARLTKRVEISAIKSLTIHHFWADLCRSMCWPIHYQKYDAYLLELFEAPNSVQILRAFATEAVSLVMIARSLHAKTRAQRKREHEEETNPQPFNDPIPGDLT